MSKLQISWDMNHKTSRLYSIHMKLNVQVVISLQIVIQNLVCVLYPSPARSTKLTFQFLDVKGSIFCDMAPRHVTKPSNIAEDVEEHNIQHHACQIRRKKCNCVIFEHLTLEPLIISASGITPTEYTGKRLCCGRGKVSYVDSRATVPTYMSPLSLKTRQPAQVNRRWEIERSL